MSQNAILEAEILKTFDVFEKRYKESYTLRLSMEAVRSGFIAKLGVNEFAVLMAIASFVDSEGEAFPSQRKLVELTGLSLPTVNRTVNNLLKVEINGKAILTRELMLSDKNKTFSVYTLHARSLEEEPPIEPEPTQELIQDVVTAPEVEPFVSVVEDAVPTLTETAILDAQSDDKAEGDKKDAETSKTAQKRQKEPKQAKKRTSRDFLFYFKELYEAEYQIPYVLNYGREGALIKNKLMTAYSEEDLLQLLEYIVKEYPNKWANERYPYPNVSMIASWIATAASQEMKKATVKEESYKEIQQLTESYVDEDYNDFDLI